MNKLIYKIKEEELAKQILKDLGNEIINYDWELKIINWKPNRRFIFKYILKKNNRNKFVKRRLRS